MRIINYKSNQTLVETKDYTAHLSYGVPQVIVWHSNSALGATVLHNNTYYSNTTSKHKNAYMKTLCTESYTFIPSTPEEITEVTGLETKQPTQAM